MNLTPRQEMVEHAANWLNRAMPWSPLVVVPRWRLQELQHDEGYSDSPGRDRGQYKRLGMDLIASLLPYRYRLLIELGQRQFRGTSAAGPSRR